MIGGVVAFFFSSGDLERERFVMVTGAVIDPVGNVPVAGVDLTVGDTSIRTSETGRFVFPSVGTKTGIRLTYPDLLRAIVKLPSTRADEQASDILFNTFLYNTLITILDREARGNVGAIYDHLLPAIQERISREAFRGGFELFFLEENLLDQEIMIRQIRRTPDHKVDDFDLRLDEIIEFEVVRPVGDSSLNGMNGDDAQWYRFVEGDDGESWYLVP